MATPPKTATCLDDLDFPMDAMLEGHVQEEPTLPPHPTSFFKRKRSTVASPLSDSSDMPIFSSDDDPAAENYRDGHGRQKRQYTGSWDCQQPIQSQSSRPESRVQRKFERQVDSGVFLGSDASADSSLDLVSIRPSASRLNHPNFAQVPRSSRPSVLSPQEAEARRIILQCLDDGNDTIDLSSMDLETISNATIAELKDISPFPHLRRGLPFTTWKPQFKLFLFQNSLTRLPKELFNLDHLTVLSLRANHLTEIPPIILRMINLQELNLSQNSLKHLPVELLELVCSPASSLRLLYLFPNPFYQPAYMRPSRYSLETTGHTPDFSPVDPVRWLRKMDALFEAKLYARTPVQLSSTRGDVLSAFRIDSGMYLATEDLFSEPTLPAPTGPRNTALKPTNKVHSLTELILQSCLRSTDITPEYWRDSSVCEAANAQGLGHIIESLEDMQQQRDSGSLQCTVCRRDIVRPTAQWIEWWELWRETQHFSGFRHALEVPFHPGDWDRYAPPLPDGRDRYPDPGGNDPIQIMHDASIFVPPFVQLTMNPNERLVPFLRRACSWKCVRDDARGLPWGQLGDYGS